jgi:phosphate transport system protein
MTKRPEQPHTVHSFDDELNHIRSLVHKTGTLAGQQILAAVDVMARRDVDGAVAVAMADAEIDQLQAEAERAAITFIGRRAPMADDLREIISAIKIAGELERVGDYAKNIAKRVPVIAETAPVEPAIIIPEIAKLVVQMIDDAIAAYIDRDPNLAVEVIQRDRMVDDFYNSLFRSLLVYMIENPQQTTQSAHLLFVAKNLERVGDHATNIAELVYYSATGKVATSRPHTAGTAYESVSSSVQS